MANTTHGYSAADAPQTASRSNETGHPEKPGVHVGISDSASPNTPTSDEVVVANFPATADSESILNDLATAGFAREHVTVLTDPARKRDFMTPYVRQDNDRHSHGSTFSAFFGALGGAFVVGLVAVALSSPFGMMALIIAAIVGGILGAIIGGLLARLAMRPADNSSINIVETLATEGTLIAVSQPATGRSSPLDAASQVLTRHNGTTVRLRPHLSLADLHPGDTRSSGIVEPLDRQPRS